MRGTDWLRRKAAAPIRIGDARPAPLAIVYTDPEPDPSMPGRLDLGGVVIAYAASGRAKVIGTRETAVATDEQQQLLDRLRDRAAADRADYAQQRGWLDCPCAVIYSRCCYPRTHLQQPS